MTINKHYFIEKSGQTRHLRTSKTGKVFSAGHESNKEDFDINQLREDLHEHIDEAVLLDYFPGHVTSGSMFAPDSGETREDVKAQAQHDEIDDTPDEKIFDIWLEYVTEYNRDLLEERIQEVLENQ
jgi:hypothetical protein